MLFAKRLSKLAQCPILCIPSARLLALIMIGFGLGVLLLPHAVFTKLIAFQIIPDQVWSLIFLFIGSMGFIGQQKRNIYLLILFYFGTAYLLITVAWSLAIYGAFPTMTTYLFIGLSAARQGTQLVEILFQPQASSKEEQ